MKDEEVLTVVVGVIAGVILVPKIINAGIMLGCFAYAGVGNAINKVKFNKKMKEGIKDGSIIEVDGRYYEVDLDAIEEV